MVHRPKWFKDGFVFVSFAQTVGINKDGEELYVVDDATGTRTSLIDDKVLEDVQSLIGHSSLTSTSRWVPLAALEPGLKAVPVYFDDRANGEFDELLATPEFDGFESVTLGELIDDKRLIARHGHGSPSADLRSGNVPYIKVSDLRAGQVNINPTNRVSEVVAEKFWRGTASGLSKYDLITPIRTSKNIGDFAVLMPGQERVVLTKEMLVLHAAEDALFDNFYLLWAMSLRAVRKQWDRIVFMQTNREDVGVRYREIRIPLPADKTSAFEVSKPFRDYYLGVQELRKTYVEHLTSSGKYHIFLSSVEDTGSPDEPVTAEIASEPLE